MGSKPKSTSQSGSGQTWAQPFASAAVGDVNSVFHANQPGLQGLTDLTQKTVVPSLLDEFNTSKGPAGQASGYYSDVLGGKYVNSNPYLDQVMKTLNTGVANDVNSQFEASGRYGSGAQADVLSKNLASADSNLLYQNYNDQMNRMDNAAQGAHAGNTADIASLISAIGAGAQIPYTGSSNLADALGALFNGGNSKQTGPNPLWGAIGAGLGAAGQVFSGKG